MPLLFDSSVWVALAFSSHPFSQQALAVFLKTDPSNSVAFCRATQQSFLRLLSSPTIQAAYGAPTITNEEAWNEWERLSALPQVRFLNEPPGILGNWATLASCKTASPKVWMDAYLAAFAISTGLTLVTLDQDFQSYQKHGLALLLLKPSL